MCTSQAFFSCWIALILCHFLAQFLAIMMCLNDNTEPNGGENIWAPKGRFGCYKPQVKYWGEEMKVAER